MNAHNECPKCKRAIDDVEDAKCMAIGGACLGCLMRKQEADDAAGWKEIPKGPEITRYTEGGYKGFWREAKM